MDKITAFLGSLMGRLVVLALLMALILFGAHQCSSARVAGKKADLSADQGQALGESAADAIEATGGVAGRSTDTDDLTRENKDAILKADGAAAPVNPAAGDAGRSSLCKRAAYRGSQQCLQFTPAKPMAGAGAGGGTPGS